MTRAPPTTSSRRRPTARRGRSSRAGSPTSSTCRPGTSSSTSSRCSISNGITSGIGGGNYAPDQATLRQQMAVFLLRGKYGLCYTPPPCEGDFPDVACPSTFADWIEALADEGITGGCGGGSYCPGNPVLRQQMAVFLLKAKHGSTYTPPPCTGAFNDVACPSTFADWIEQLAEEEITGGCGGGQLLPAQQRHARTDGGVHREDVRTAVGDAMNRLAMVFLSRCHATCGRDIHRHQHGRLRRRIPPPGDPGRQRNCGRRHDRVRHPGRRRPHDHAVDAAAADRRGRS